MSTTADFNPTNSVRWVRAPRIPSATRTDGISLLLREGKWIANAHGTSRELQTPPVSYLFERALEEVDETFPPPMWTHRDGVWVADLWHVVPEGDGSWSVYRNIEGIMDRASQQSFQTADRARRWAELRFDRGAQSLRGPKSRAGARSMEKLPDVRVTASEREQAILLLEQHDISYSQFVRAALAWVEENVGEGMPWRVERRNDSVSFVAATDA